ncbi:hypothetical protein SLS60_009356 [Paraconiothyrium brasiliense]|uniref:CSI2 protein n=1 Tax=Paraconiothyrium brasiliense TaxID=300254 RepID=A0ABR3QU40_9PLEO
MRISIRLAGVLAFAAPAVLAQNNQNDDNTTTNQPSASQATDKETQTSAPAQTTEAPKTTDAPSTTEGDSSTEESASSSEAPKTTDAGSSASGNFVSTLPVTTSTTAAPTQTQDSAGNFLSLLPSQAGVGIPDVGVPDTAGAAFMQKSDLPDGTVFICVGAILAFFGLGVLVWRGLVAWSLHRSVKRAALAQNLADLKDMSAVPGGRKRGMYNVVGASSTMSLDHLSAAPTGTSKPPKPFASTTTSTPPKSNSLFFSPTAGGSTGLRDSVANRSSQYLPAGYYTAGNAQAAQGSPMTHVGGAGAGSHLSTHSLAMPGNRYSARSGISPPQSPSLPPSRGYDRAPPSRDGLSIYNRNSVATLGSPTGRAGVYGNDHGSASQLSLNGLNVPGGSTTGGRAPSAYLEDLFENHGNGPRERF